MENRLLFAAGVKQKNQLYHFSVLKMDDQTQDTVDLRAWETGTDGWMHFTLIAHRSVDSGNLAIVHLAKHIEAKAEECKDRRET